MALKQRLRRLLPAPVRDAARRVLDPLTGPPAWQYLPGGWATQDPRIKGWNEPSILAVERAKWPVFARLVDSPAPLTMSAGGHAVHNNLVSYAYVFARAAHGHTHLSMLDWGGGVGQFYLISKASLPEVAIDYHVKDVPILCRGGRELLPQAHFYEDEEDAFARRYDFVLASDTLQYIQDWRRVVARLAGATRTYLYIVLPVVQRAPSFVVVQRPYGYGYDTEFMGWFLNRGEFLAFVAAQGLTLAREFLLTCSGRPRGAPEAGECRGFLFQAAASGSDPL